MSYSDEAVKHSGEWRREWIKDGSPTHSCLQNMVHLLSDETLCGVCGAVFALDEEPGKGERP